MKCNDRRNTGHNYNSDNYIYITLAITIIVMIIDYDHHHHHHHQLNQVLSAAKKMIGLLHHQQNVDINFSCLKMTMWLLV